MPFLLFCDGGARGNPGPAAAGVVLQEANGRTLLAAGYLLGELTNNQAEYSALMLGLQAAVRWQVDDLQIRSDSELMVRQLLGQYRVTSPQLKPYFEDVQRALLRIDSWQIEHIPREANSHADQLVNLALDRGEDVVQSQLGPGPPQLSPDEAGRSTGNDVEIAPATDVILARVVRSGDVARGCGGCTTGQQFRFAQLTPAELCLAAAAVLIPRVVALRNGDDDRPESAVDWPLIIDSPCGARFELSQPAANDAARPA
ncbi:MAG: Ribonuclease H [Phycisphaerae bacterium]|nr:Ribonuclease H [Phycisphaerae bacterium]